VRHRIRIVGTAFIFLAALCTAGGERAAAEESPRLRLVWIDVLDLAPFAFPFATREAAAILAEAGVATAWTLATPSTETGVDELRILLLGEPVARARLSRRVMGCTRRDGNPRATWVYLSTVLWALGLPSQAARGLLAREQEEVGRALGRVVAHEIVHALVPDLPHRQDGLMAGHLTRVLLVCSRVSLTPHEGRALRARLASSKTMK
jgi:hypothetical protein